MKFSQHTLAAGTHYFAVRSGANWNNGNLIVETTPAAGGSVNVQASIAPRNINISDYNYENLYTAAQRTTFTRIKILSGLSHLAVIVTGGDADVRFLCSATIGKVDENGADV